MFLIRIVIFIVVLFIALPYIKNASDTVMNKIPGAQTVKTIASGIGEMIKK
jgi:hypothetical protein